MTDRELLELAAKAVGHKEVDWASSSYEGRHRGAYVLLLGPPKQVMEAPDQIEWNPLIDDGDAFRLAVTLRLDFSIVEFGGVEQVEVSGPFDGFFTEDIDSPQGQFSAGRRAIVRAAAEIGKAVP